MATPLRTIPVANPDPTLQQQIDTLLPGILAQLGPVAGPHANLGPSGGNLPSAYQYSALLTNALKQAGVDLPTDYRVEASGQLVKEPDWWTRWGKAVVTTMAAGLSSAAVPGLTGALAPTLGLTGAKIAAPALVNLGTQAATGQPMTPTSLALDVAGPALGATVTPGLEAAGLSPTAAKAVTPLVTTTGLSAVRGQPPSVGNLITAGVAGLQGVLPAPTGTGPMSLTSPGGYPSTILTLPGGAQSFADVPRPTDTGGPVSNGNGGDTGDGEDTGDGGTPSTPTPTVGWPPQVYNPTAPGGGGSAPPPSGGPSIWQDIATFLQKSGVAPSIISGLTSYLGARTSAGTTLSAAQLQAQAALKAAQIQQQSEYAALDFARKQALQSITTQNAINQANYNQWANRQGRINNFMNAMGFPTAPAVPAFTPIPTDPSLLAAITAPGSTPPTPPGSQVPLPPGTPPLGRAQPRPNSFASLTTPTG